MSSPAVAADNRSIGGARARLANGRLAVADTIATITRSRTQAGAARLAPTTIGAPAATSAPAPIATTPAAMAGATSGTTARFTAGAMIDRRPNEARMSGRVAACAASDTPRFSVSQRGRWPRPNRSIAPARGVAQAMRPAVASADSWSPASRTSPGSASSRSVTVQPSAVAAWPARPLSLASRTTPAMTPARTTEADAPANTTYATIAPIVATDRRLRPSFPANAPTAAATIAMFQPEMATTWLTPAVVKSAARPRSTRSRRPMRIPAASPASGSGRTDARADPAERRSSSRARAGLSGEGRTLNVFACSVPSAPIRLRYCPYGESGGGRIDPSIATTSPGTTAGYAGRVAATLSVWDSIGKVASVAV